MRSEKALGSGWLEIEPSKYKDPFAKQNKKIQKEKLKIKIKLEELS
jgi:hypothetical protein